MIHPHTINLNFGTIFHWAWEVIKAYDGLALVCSVVSP